MLLASLWSYVVWLSKRPRARAGAAGQAAGYSKSAPLAGPGVKSHTFLGCFDNRVVAATRGNREARLACPSSVHTISCITIKAHRDPDGEAGRKSLASTVLTKSIGGLEATELGKGHPSEWRQWCKSATGLPQAIGAVFPEAPPDHPRRVSRNHLLRAQGQTSTYCWCDFVGNVGMNPEIPFQGTTRWIVYRGHSLIPY